MLNVEWGLRTAARFGIRLYGWRFAREFDGVDQ
jgi:hypothetical protein